MNEGEVARQLAAVEPCRLYKHRFPPRPSRTQGHHRYPAYLQRRLWGEVRRHELLWLCGLCHDSVHDWISYLLREARQPYPTPGLYHRREAERAVEWYRLEQAKLLGPQAP